MNLGYGFLSNDRLKLLQVEEKKNEPKNQPKRPAMDCK